MSLSLKGIFSKIKSHFKVDINNEGQLIASLVRIWLPKLTTC
jgi:hypothetical protein